MFDVSVTEEHKFAKEYSSGILYFSEYKHTPTAHQQTRSGVEGGV